MSKRKKSYYLQFEIVACLHTLEADITKPDQAMKEVKFYLEDLWSTEINLMVVLQ